MTATVPRSIAHVLDEAVRRVPENDALVARSGTLTYTELDAAADRAAAALWRRGARPGGVIAAALPNDLDIVVAFHATMRLGGVWLGINRQLAASEQVYLLRDAGAHLLLADDEVVAGLVADEGQAPELPAGLEIVTVRPCDIAWSRPGWSGDGSDADLAALEATIDPHAPAALAYTSGTTGHPKGVIHSQYNLLLPGAVLVETRGYDVSLRKGDCLPLTILNMLVLTTLLVSQCGGTCIIMDRIDAGGLADWIRSQRIGTWNGVPAMLSSLAADDSVHRDDLASLDEVWVGGDSCPEAIERAFASKFGVRPVGCYGLTEAPTMVTIDDRGERRRSDGSGWPLPHLDVTIRDDEDREVATGTEGEICVEPTAEGAWAGAYRPMLGYLHQPEATAKALTGARLRTGDIGSFGDEGDLTIRSRRSALIIRGGANVYPAEVERVIVEVDGVGACAVFGRADDRLGQRVTAAVELADGARPDAVRTAIVEACSARLAKYKVPDRIVVVDRLLRNAMGKVDRRALPALVHTSDTHV